jgi:pimeloyl-ACP methyl ester carboxylesterase
VADVVRSIGTPVLLVGHSYGGAVITNVAADAAEITGLVYVAAFAPEPGESAFTLRAMFPGSTLGDALEETPRDDGTTDLTIARDKFHPQFCADVPAAEARRMAVTQRPITREALLEPSGEHPLWRTHPSWFVFGEEDRNIPEAAERYMAKRAQAHRIVDIPGASHALSVAHPHATAHLIREAAAVRLVA